MTNEGPIGLAGATIAGEELWLLAERAVYWPARHTLLVANPHFGAAAPGVGGSFGPMGTAAPLSRLSRLIMVTAARRLIFLGDLHGAGGQSEAMCAALAVWRQSHGAITMTLVRGNHDIGAGDPCTGIDRIDGPLVEGPFVLAHHPVPVASHYVLAGHAHPGAMFRGRARQRERVPGFWFGREAGVLPAFGEFAGWPDITPAEGERAWVIRDGEVIEVAATARISGPQAADEGERSADRSRRARAEMRQGANS